MPKLSALKVLLATPVTLEKLTPTTVLALALELVDPTKAMPRPLTVVAVAEALVLVTVRLSPVPATPEENPCVMVPVPVVKVRFWLAAMVAPALKSGVALKVLTPPTV